jgi:FkbM family methyltransferase
MNTKERKELIDTIIKREQLRLLNRTSRLLHDPINALPYYILATCARIKPFRMTFKTLWHTHMTCFLPEGNTFYYYGYCEANLTNFFTRYTQEGMVCMDVGAHVGIYSMLFSELTGKKGSVHSFEPTPWTFELLKENTKKLSNVHINNNAIAETKRTLIFADYGPGYGAYNSAHSGGAPALDKQPDISQIDSISLDNYCSQNSIIPNIIKIDSEGFEFEVLSGAKSLLLDYNKQRPLVTIEVANGEEWADNRNKAFAFLQSANYTAYEINVSGHITPHHERTMYEYDNLLFIPTERIDELKKLII